MPDRVAGQETVGWPTAPSTSRLAAVGAALLFFARPFVA